MIEMIVPMLWGGALAAALLTASHALLWDGRDRFPLVARYTVGVACLNIGLNLTGYLLGDPFLIFAPWGIAGVGGATVAALHLWRYHKSAPLELRLLRRGLAENRGVGDGAWEARESDHRQP